jgi:hypothetical protein
MHIFKRSNLIKSNKSYINLISYINFTSYINFIALRKKDKIKTKKANKVKLKD